MTTESQRYDSFIRNGRNAIPYHACPKAKGSNPTNGLSLLWVRNLFRGSSNQRHESQEQARRILPRRITRQKDFRICEIGGSQEVAQFHDSYMMIMMMLLMTMMMTITCGPTRHNVTSTFSFNIPSNVLVIYIYTHTHIYIYTYCIYIYIC